MYPSVTHVMSTEDYKVLLTFDNGERRCFDVAPYLTIGRFAELRDPAAFRQVSISFDTIEWANGMDIDPEILYQQSQLVLEPVR